MATLIAAPQAAAVVPSLDAARYRAQANAICSSFGRWTPPPGNAKVQLTALNGRFRTVVDELSALQPPPTLVKLRTKVVVVLHHELGFLDSQLTLLETGKITPQHYQQNIDAAGYATAEDALWHRIGAHACATT